MGLYSEWFFPRLVDWGMRSDVFARQRATLLADAGGEVLEIGLGTGLNLPFYPSSVTRLTAIDTSSGMLELAEKKRDEVSFSVLLKRLSGEELPFADASFDTVVSTWTLCSIPDVSRALSEVRRVLRPSGKLLFIEHGLSPEASVRKWQHRLNPLQRRLGLGCNLNRDIPALVEGSGLRIGPLERFYLKRAPRLLGYTFKGWASRE